MAFGAYAGCRCALRDSGLASPGAAMLASGAVVGVAQILAQPARAEWLAKTMNDALGMKVFTRPTAIGMHAVQNALFFALADVCVNYLGDVY